MLVQCQDSSVCWAVESCSMVALCFLCDFTRFTKRSVFTTVSLLLCIRILTVLSKVSFAVGFALEACYAAGGTKASCAEGKVPLLCSRLRHV